jgi:hypothetical protein
MIPLVNFHSLTVLSFIVIALDYGSSWFITPISCHFRRVNRPKVLLFAGIAPDRYQERAESLIREVGRQCGADDLRLEWKPGRLKVVILGNAYLSDPIDENDPNSQEDENDEELDPYEDSDNEDEPASSFDDSEFLLDDIDNMKISQSSLYEINEIDDMEEDPPQGVDITVLARAINIALATYVDPNTEEDDNIVETTNLGTWIAETHEIEVTTPGSPDELSGIMWDVYRGFDVLCDHIDPKTKQPKTFEGKLKERTSEFTVLTIKGRIKKLKNRDLLSVRLPKAKKEKGGG